MIVPVPCLAQPSNLARRVAEKETENREARAHYMYRQEVVIQEIHRGTPAGQYSETREVIFSPSGERTERMTDHPVDNLKRLRLTEEDFRDIRDVQPFLFTTDQLFLYETRPRGEEVSDGIDCWVLEVRPRQVLDGQRLFDGLFWVDKRDFSVVKTEGVAVPQILRRKQENLFPRFTTFRDKIDGKYWFPRRTYGDDTLPFSSGPIRMKLDIRYSDYRRFGSESTVTFEPR
ncbi:MAG: hypothetical protein FJW20_22490 [Acidimicrobiia bacterium]|nr:hypothetical protein [Acidimicrobiia bacterium]